MDTGDVVGSTIATLSLIATAILAYRQTRLQAKLTAIEQTWQRQAVEARQHADVQATVTGTPTALQLVLANDGPATATGGSAPVPGTDAGRDDRARTSRCVMERRRRPAPRILHGPVAIGTGS